MKFHCVALQHDGGVSWRLVRKDPGLVVGYHQAEAGSRTRNSPELGWLSLTSGQSRCCKPGISPDSICKNYTRESHRLPGQSGVSIIRLP